MTSPYVWIYIPIALFLFAVFSGIPLWMVLRRPDRAPQETQDIPEYYRQRMLAERSKPRSSAPRDEATPRMHALSGVK